MNKELVGVDMSVPHRDGVDEAQRLIYLADSQGIPMRLLGGIAIYLQVPTWTARQGGPRKDIDFVIRQRDTAAITSMMERAGYTPDRQQNAVYGHKQLYFVDTASGRPIDVIVDHLEMCHTLPLADRLTLSEFTLPLADLVLTKLQIVQPERKDLLDVIALLCEHPLTETDTGINVRRICDVLAADWGWWRTSTGNLERCDDLLATLVTTDLDFGHPASHDPAEQIANLRSAIDAAPKGMKWKLRSRLGDRAIWYDEPEEVVH